MNQKLWIIANELRPEPLPFLWPGFIPRRAITLLEGDPATGKSSIAADIGARVTLGASMPLQNETVQQVETAGVLVLSGEESPAVVAAHFRAAGADLSRVAILSASNQINLVTGLEILQRAVTAVKAKLIIVDPVTEFLGVNINQDQSVRRALQPLVALAQKNDLAILLVRHLTKSARRAIYAGSGSIALTGLARSVLSVGMHPTESGMRVLSVAKSNVSAPKSIGYRISISQNHLAISDDLNSLQPCAHVVWTGLVETTADELVRRTDSEALSQLEEAQDFIYGELQEEPRLVNELLKKASTVGVSHSTLKRAKKSLGVRSIKRGVGKSQAFWWALPQNQDKLHAVKRRNMDALCDELFHGDIFNIEPNENKRSRPDDKRSSQPDDNDSEPEIF